MTDSVIELPMPQMTERDVRLTATSHRSAGQPTSAPEGLDGRVRLGGPAFVPIRPSSDFAATSPDLRAFIEQEARQRAYFLVHISLTFEQAPDEPPLESAALDVTLSSPEALRRPIAWSMVPLRITDPSEVTTSFTIHPHLKLGGTEISGFEAAWSGVRQQSDVFLQAFRELRADPGWRLRRTPTMPLFGSYRFAMVVRAEKGQVAELELDITAAVRKRGFLRTYSYQLPGPIRTAEVLR